MNYIKNNYKNWLVLLFGILVLSLGGAILIFANIGSDSVTVFSQGLKNVLSVSYGLAYMVGNIFFLIFMLIFHRKKLGVGTVVVAILTGLLIDLYLKYIPFVVISNKILNFMFSFSGLVLAALGIALYIYSNIGLGVYEGFADYFADKFKIKFGIIKIIFDAILFGLGVLMGGKFGITSIVSVIVLGPLIDLFSFLIKKTNIIKSPIIDLDN